MFTRASTFNQTNTSTPSPAQTTPPPARTLCHPQHTASHMLCRRRQQRGYNCTRGGITGAAHPAAHRLSGAGCSKGQTRIACFARGKQSHWRLAHNRYYCYYYLHGCPAGEICARHVCAKDLYTYAYCTIAVRRGVMKMRMRQANGLKIHRLFYRAVCFQLHICRIYSLFSLLQTHTFKLNRLRTTPPTAAEW